MKATIVENPQTMNLKHVLVASQHLRTSIEKYRMQKAVESAITQILVGLLVISFPYVTNEIVTAEIVTFVLSLPVEQYKLMVACNVCSSTTVGLSQLGRLCFMTLDKSFVYPCFVPQI